MNDIQRHFGERIRKARELRGISTAELAAAMNVSETTVDYWETSELELPDAITKKIVGILDVSLSYLLGDSDNPDYKLLPARETVPVPPPNDRRKNRLWLRDLPSSVDSERAPEATFTCLRICGDLLNALEHEGKLVTPNELAALVRELEKIRALAEEMRKKKL